MKKILFPFQIDNDIYLEAFIIARKFARQLDLKLILLNVFDVELDDNITPQIYNKKVKDKWDLAFDEVAKFNNYYHSKYGHLENETKIQLERRFVHSNEIKEITNIIEKEDIDLFIFPLSEDKQHYKKYIELLENDIFHQNSTSILVLPVNYQYKDIHKMVFSTDLKDHHYNEFYFNKILNYSTALDAKINFLYINTDKNNSDLTNNKTLTYINKIISQNKQHHYKTIEAKEISEAVLAYTKGNRIDLVSVINEDLNLISSLFHKSISKEILISSQVPVLFMVEKNQLPQK